MNIQLAACLILVAAPACPAQEPTIPSELPVSGETLLRQSWVRLRPPGGAWGTVCLTFAAHAHTPDELRRTTEPYARWHPGGSVWPILETPHALQFGVGEPDSTLWRRSLVPPGRYVLSVQNTDDSSRLVLTRADAVESVLAPSEPEGLPALGGFYLRGDSYDEESAVAQTTVRFEPDFEAEGAELCLRVGGSSWTLWFEVRVSPPADRSEETRRGVEQHLERLAVAPAIRRALLDAPGQLAILTLDPESFTTDSADQPLAGTDRFHGYRVLGERALDLSDDEQRRAANRLQDLLRASVLAHPDTMVEDCFFPRHGLRIRSAVGEVDLVVCFQCSQGSAWLDGDRLEESLYLKDYWERPFSDVCRGLGLEVAK